MPRRANRTATPRAFRRRELVTYPPDGMVPNGGIDEGREQLDLELNQWTEGLDAEPMPDGVRRRNGLTYASDTIGSSVTDNATGSDDFTALNSTNFVIAQQFVLGGATVIEGVTVELKMAAQPPSSYAIRFEIRADDTGEPGAAAVASFGAANFNKVRTDDIGTSFAEHEFNMLDPTSLGAGTYWFLLILANITSGYDVIAKANLGAGSNDAGYAAGDISSTPWTWTIGASDELIYDVRQPASETEITAIHDFQLDDGTQRHLVCFTETVYKNVADTLTSVGTFDTAHTKDDAPCFITVDDRVAATNGESGDPSKTLYLEGSTDRWQNEGIAAPTTALVLAGQTTGGFLAAGDYYVDYFYLNSAAPREIRSNTKYDGASGSGNTANVSTGTTGSIDVTTHGTAVARTDDRADRKAFYILGPGTGGQWRRATLSGGLDYVAIATGGTLTITGFTSEEGEFDHDLPPTHSIKLATSSRQFIAGVEGQPRRIQWTRVRGVDVDVESYPTWQRKDLGARDDEVRGLAFVPPSIVLVGMRNSLWAIDEAEPHRDAELIVDGVGFAGKRAVSVVENRAYFWSDAKKRKGPYVWTGKRVERLSKLEKFVNGEDGVGGLNRSRHHLISCAHYAPDKARYQWWSLVSLSGQTDHSRIVVWDYELDAPTIYRIDGNVLGEVEVSGIDRVMIGQIAGREAQADSGNSDLGSEIEGSFKMRPLTMGDLHDRAKLKGIVTRSKSTNLGDLLLQIEVDLGEGQQQAVTLQQSGAAGSLLGTGVLGAFELAGSAQLFRKNTFRVSGRVFTPTFKGTSPWELNRLAWLVQASGRK